MVAPLDECVFCDIVAGRAEAEMVFQSEEHCCIQDRYPVTKGHALLFPKRHIQYLEAADWESLTAALDRAIDAVCSNTEPDGLNVGLNDGAAAGQTIPHLHWHIIPRNEGDMENPDGGVRGVIPSKQQY